MNSEEKNSVFNASLLSKIPVYLRHLTEISEADTGEFYTRHSFSESLRHQAKCYINAPIYKPVSAILIEDFLNELKTK